MLRLQLVLLLPLVLLLRGLSDVVVRYPDIKHFIGPVSISSWYPKFYQSMIVKYVTEKHPVSDELAHMATPMTPFRPEFLKVDADVLMPGNMESIDKFDKFMFRLSNSQILETERQVPLFQCRPGLQQHARLAPVPHFHRLPRRRSNAALPRQQR